MIQKPAPKKVFYRVEELLKHLQTVEPDLNVSLELPEGFVKQGDGACCKETLELLTQLLAYQQNNTSNMAEQLQSALDRLTLQQTEQKTLASGLKDMVAAQRAVESRLASYEEHMSRAIARTGALTSALDSVTLAIRDNANLEKTFQQIKQQIKELEENREELTNLDPVDVSQLSFKVYGAGRVSVDNTRMVLDVALEGKTWRNPSVLVEHNTPLEAGSTLTFLSSDTNYAVGLTQDPLGQDASRYYGNDFALFRIKSSTLDHDGDGVPDDGIRPYTGRTKRGDRAHTVKGDTELKLVIVPGKVQYFVEGNLIHSEPHAVTGRPLYLWVAAAKTANLKIYVS